MFRSFACAALPLLCAAIATPLAAEPTATAAPPAWQDGASVYLTMNQAAASNDENAPAIPAAQNAAPTAAPVGRSQTAPIVDAAVAPAAYDAAAELQPAGDGRWLAPPSDSVRTGAANLLSASERAGNTSRRAMNFGLPPDSLYTMASALAIVIGAFLLCVWMMRRGAARSRASMLPADVVSVLGRVPLAARQFAELLRVGNKLVLITLTPAGATTLTEVTEPNEVDRLVGLCQQSDPHSTTKAFEQVFRQMSLEPVRGGFLGDELPLPSLQSSFDALRAQRGDTARA